MELSEDQSRALERLLAWYAAPSGRFITMGGYAGTGKTTLIAAFRREAARLKPGAKFSFCSYTGRAAQHLRNRLKEAGALLPGDTVSTIHSLIYDPLEAADGRIAGWNRRDALERDLIIVDEASMVDAVIWNDLLSYGIPVIAVGDHGQLPPIGGEFDLMRAPEITLTQIHRQADGDPIIEVSRHARETGLVPPRRYGPHAVKYLMDDPDAQEASGELLQSYNPETLILCGYNSTRVKINRFVRGALGYEGEAPARGDRVICLRNNSKKGIYNGMLGTVQALAPAAEGWLEAEILMDEREKPYTGLIYAAQFNAKEGTNFTADRRATLAGDLFDFGYALTVHKAQGGQARRVVLFEERFPRMDDAMWRRWLYTGVTRAEEELYLFGS